MKNRYVVLTGVSGYVGSSLAKIFSHNGYLVIGIDLHPPKHEFCNFFLEFDLLLILNCNHQMYNFRDVLISHLSDGELHAFIHSAAIQKLDDNDFSDVSNFINHQVINSASALFFYRVLYDFLCATKGQFINIGSVHSLLTKPNFLSYSASKSSLRSLTKSLAIENKGAFRIFSIEPAAIDTPMLNSGFKDEKNIVLLRQFHPANHICTSDELALFVFDLFSTDSMFLHGSNIDFNGGISARLHDPE